MHFGKRETPCSDCMDGYCTMNCGPAISEKTERPAMTPEQREEFRNQPCGLTNGQWADMMASAVIMSTKGTIRCIRRAAELEPTFNGKRALKTVADILESTNK